jgi:membrane-bound lytic murein transglycosylase D
MSRTTASGMNLATRNSPQMNEDLLVTPRLSPLMLVLAGIGCAAGSSTTNEPVARAVPEESAAQPSAAGGDFVSDSAADAEILEFLADSRLDPASPDYAARGGGGGPDAMASTVTWDIGVQPFIDHHRVRYYLDFFQGQARDRFAIWLTRLPKYESMIRDSMIANDVPSDMVYLALIESGYSNTAVSRSRAVGMWQFMRETGRMYGLRVDYWIDERRDPYKATDAAARHLADLRDRFGSLFLAAAAYNAGAGRVSRGLKRLPASQGDPDDLSDSTFFQLYQTRYLVRETKDYVPKLIAAALIAKEPERYGFTVPEGIEPFAYDSLVVPDATGLDVIASLADTDLRTIRTLNPQYIRLATPPGERAMVRVPVGIGDSTAARFAVLPASQRVTYLVHVVKNGDTMGHIGERYRVSLRDLQLANPGVKPRTLRIGYKLIIPTGGIPSREVRLAMQGNPNRPSVAYHSVRSGDSIWLISRRYGISQAQLRQWNGLSGDVIRPGQTLRVQAR